MDEKTEVVFANDMELCYDGVNVKKYNKGEVYEATHAHEKRMFHAFLDDGRATVPTKKEAPKDEEKVSHPKQKKSKKAKK